MITREEALRIGSAAVIANGLGTGASKACLLEELEVREPKRYGGPDLPACWIVYADIDVLAICSSTIVLVSKESGEVLYMGSANDEG